MRLYTICAHNRPILTMSVACELPMPDRFTTDAMFMKAHRDERALIDKLRAEDPAFDRISDQREIDEALNTWLGEDLLCLETERHPLWSGRRSDLGVREATADEAERWKASRQHAIDTGEIDAGSEMWLMFLVPVQDPTDAD